MYCYFGYIFEGEQERLAHFLSKVGDILLFETSSRVSIFKISNMVFPFTQFELDKIET